MRVCMCVRVWFCVSGVCACVALSVGGVHVWLPWCGALSLLVAVLFSAYRVCLLGLDSPQRVCVGSVHRCVLCGCVSDTLMAWVVRQEHNAPLRTSGVNEVSPADVVLIGCEEDAVVEVEVAQPAPGSLLSLYRESWTVIVGWAPAEVSSGVPVLRMSRIPAVWYGKDLLLNVRLKRAPHRVQTYTCRACGAAIDA